MRISPADTAGEIYVDRNGNYCLKKNSTHELGKRLLFSALVLAAYMAGRSLLLYRVDPAAYQLEELGAQNIMISMLSGDRHQYTLFALGIMPYITASLIVWVVTAARGEDAKNRLSPQRMERMTAALMLFLAAASALSRAGELVFLESGVPRVVLQAIAAVEMTAGAAIIYKMADFNKEYGVGAQTPLMLVNLVDNLFSTMRKYTWSEAAKPLAMCFVMSAVILVMENIIIRIPIQRVSIHNSYADKSYMAFKLDMIGVMPVMFAISFFMMPQQAISLLLRLDGDNAALLGLRERLTLQDPLGVAVYLGIVFALSILFSFLMLTPGQAAEQLQKGGDSIVGVYAGKRTKSYLRRRVLLLSIFDGLILCLMMGISLGLSLAGEIPPQLALFPSTGMIMTGMSCTLYREVKSYRIFDSYRFFI